MAVFVKARIVSNRATFNHNSGHELKWNLELQVWLCIYIYTQIHIYACVYMHIYVYLHIYKLAKYTKKVKKYWGTCGAPNFRAP